MLKKIAIEEFKKIYEEEYNIKLSNEQAARKATVLLNFFKVILKLPNSEDLPKIVIKD